MVGMLTDRKQKILKAIVEGYIQTGEPVGSKTLLSETGIDVSPATVRNDMADLTARGYLFQPHTSAGRAPSQKGMRYYVDNLMSPVTPPERVRDYIDAKLSAAADTPEQLLREAAKLLSDYTGYAAVTTTPPSGDARVHRLHFIGTGRHTVMVVLVTSSGMVRSKLFRSNFVVTNEVLEILRETLNKALSGVPLSQINKPFMQTVAASFTELFLVIPQALTAIMEIAASAQVVQLCLSGETKLLFAPEVDAVTSRGILGFLSDTEQVAKLLLSQKSSLCAYLGTECRRAELLTAAVICARYEIEGTTAGAVALFGPGRMDFADAMGAVNYISQSVGDLLSEMVDL